MDHRRYGPDDVGGPLPINWTEPSWSGRVRTFITERDRWSYANWIDRVARLYGPRTAFVLDRPIDYPGFSGEILSFRDMARLVSRMAHALRELGVRRGDRVGMITMNRIEMAFCNFAAAKIGAIPVPMNFMLKPPEIDTIMRRAGAEVLVCDEMVFGNTIRSASDVPSVKTWAMLGQAGEAPAPCASMAALMADAPDHVDPVEPDSPFDTAILFFTSGTTGFPKGAMVSHAATMVGMRYRGPMYAALPKAPRRFTQLVMPVAHAGGYASLVFQIGFGTPAYFLSKFDPATILDNIERYRITLMAGTPAMYRMLLQAGARERDLRSIRLWAGGADAFSDDLVGAVRALGARPGPFGTVRRPKFIRGYGMAEANSYVSQTPPFECGDNCIGWVRPPVRFRIVDESGRDVPRGETGELWIRGPNVTRGYWGDPEATAAAITPGGWFRTGDVVRQGKWRMLYFVDRTNDVIKSGGYKISAAEIDQVLTQHPDVAHAATVGVRDDIKGQRPMSAVLLTEGAGATPDTILEWARERMAPYKCPRRIFVMPDLPFTFSMKPKRNAVRERIEEILASE